jgi:anti-sigma regulatory factor (Ser/Thr protein kinase)
MPSRRSAVAPTVEKILAAVEPAHLSEERRVDLAVAVAEALSNAAVHGNGLRGGVPVGVFVEARSSGLVEVEVRDSGHGFDAGETGDPTDPSHLLLPGGRGIFLMRRLVDVVEYNARGNVVRLKFRPRSRRKVR